jgi:hypothetical protein
MTFPAGLRARLGAGALATLALILAAPVAAQAAGCADQPSSRPFAPWGDDASYVLAPDGGFENAAPGWSLDDGAAVQDGNQDTQAAADGDSSSLALPAGSEATTPPICIDIAHPTIRFFARNTGSPSSALGVSVVYRGLLGIPLTLPVGTVGAGSDWAPGDPVPVLVNLLALLHSSDVTFRFTPLDGAGDWSIDDVYVDPYSKG